MKRVVTSAGVTEITTRNGVTHRRQRDGSFHLGDRQAAAAIKGDGGFIVPECGTATSRDQGYRCECGFGSWFTTCSKCGGTCSRETDA